MTGRSKTSATNTSAATGKPKTTTVGTPSNSRSSSPPKAPSTIKGGSGSGNAAAGKQKTATTGSGRTSRGVTTPNATSGSNSGTGGGSVPPPPPPPRPPAMVAEAKKPVPESFVPPKKTPAGSYHVSLAVYGGAGRYKPHWAFFVHTPTDKNSGIMIHANGDVNDGFTFEIKRNHDFTITGNRPKLIFLQSVEGKHFNDAMWNGGKHGLEKPGVPRCPFETSAAKAPAPGKSLNTVKDGVSTSKSPPKAVTQSNCQTWVVEAAKHLVRDGIFLQDRLDYLVAIKD